MARDSDTRISRRLSYVLRHDPGSIGVELDQQGWVDVDTLLDRLAASGTRLSRAELEGVVERNDKQRFRLDGSRSRIRASQGHSVPVDLGLVAAEPPATLFHGTVASALPGIRAHGLVKGGRHHVHLSADKATAHRVGSRRGTPVVLRVDAAAMRSAGIAFFRSDNGVWLTDHVEPRHLGLDQPAAGSSPPN